MDEDERFLSLWDQLPVEYQGQYWNIYNTLFGVFGRGYRTGTGAVTPTPPRPTLSRRLRPPSPQPRAVSLDPYGRVGTGRSPQSVVSRATDEYTDDDGNSVESEAGSLDILTMDELLKEDLSVLPTDNHQASSASIIAQSGG